VPNPSLVRRHKGLVRHTAHQLLQIDLVRFGVAWARHRWYGRRLRTLGDTGAVAADTVSHNLKGMRDLAVVRSLNLVRPLSVLEDLRPDADVLVVGPRTEGELLAFLAHGFDRAHVKAVDLTTYSPWVDLGDMHDLPYADDAFDCTVAGWVLAYSDDKRAAVGELVRVTRPGGYVALGVEWSPRSNEEYRAELGYVPGSEERIGSAEQILDLFDGGAVEVVFRQDADPSVTETQNILLVLRLAKAG
jgi:SAM-dependent methyltransferase